MSFYIVELACPRNPRESQHSHGVAGRYGSTRGGSNAGANLEASPGGGGPETHGTSMGAVTDPTGAVVPGAKVTITNMGTSVKRTFVTDSFGACALSLLALGTTE